MCEVVARGLLVSSLLTGCIIDNPDFDDPSAPSQGSGAPTLSGTSGSQTSISSASESEGSSGTMSATATTTSTGSTSAVTGSTGTTSTGTSSTGEVSTSIGEGSSSTGDGTSSTGSSDFEPFSVQNYVKESCKYYSGCFAMQQPYPTKLHAMECFSTELEPPFVIESVSALVDFRVGNVPVKVALHSAEEPGGPAITAVDLPAFAGSGGIHEFVLPDPIPVGSPEFCVRLTTGNVNTALAVGFDHKTAATPDSYIQQQVDCKAPFTPLDVYMETNQATWCMSVKLAPP